uniref:Uncharacterized protein n=1 Tax=Rhizophora mucronata TaxID=61149 RepID=A0A2P2PUC3_RHIMU
MKYHERFTIGRLLSSFPKHLCLLGH